MTVTAVVVSVVLTFAFSGIVVNWLIYRWQYRNWINQQRFLGSEKKYEALQAHADEISRAAAGRLSAMFRLLSSLSLGKDQIEERLKIYSDAIDNWNKHINEFYFKTTMYVSFEMTQRLETTINGRFVKIGSDLERAVRFARNDVPMSAEDRLKIRDNLNSLQGTLGNFNRDMLRVVMRQHRATYNGVQLRYRRRDLNSFSTLNLIKALFVSDVEALRITLTSFELEPPAIREP